MAKFNKYTAVSKAGEKGSLDLGAKETTLELLKRLNRGDELVEKIIVKRHLKLVYNIAGKIYTNNRQKSILEKKDLFQEGLLGLIKAIRTFNPQRSDNFINYAHRLIHQSIILAIKSSSKVMRLPLHIILEIQEIGRINKKFEQLQNHCASPEEIALETGMSLKKISFSQNWLNNGPIYLSDLVFGENEKLTYADILACQDSFLDDGQSLIYEKILTAFIKLDSREKKIMQLFLGLDQKYCRGGFVLSIRQISEISEQVFGKKFSPERIRQFRESAYEKIRCYFEKLHYQIKKASNPKIKNL